MISEHPLIIKAIPVSLMMLAVEVRRVGSLATCSPRPESTDADFLVLVKDITEAADALIESDFEREGYLPPDGITPSTLFLSFRKGMVNILITHDQSFYDKFCMATDIATRLNLQDRESRVKLFQAVLYGK